MIANVLTDWIGTGTDLDPHRPRLEDDYPGITYTDVTNQADPPTTPNLYTIQVEDTEAVIETIDNDPAHLVVWDE